MELVQFIVSYVVGLRLFYLKVFFLRWSLWTIRYIVKKKNVYV